MSTEEYINEVYKKYAQTQEQNIKYKVVKMRPRRPLIPLCIIVICLVAAGYMGFGLKNYERVENPEITDYVQKEENEKKIYTEFFMTDARWSREYLGRLFTNSTDIVLISEFDIDRVVCDIYDENIEIQTIMNLKISRILKNSNIIESEFLEVWRKGGMISFAELEKNPKFDLKKLDKSIVEENIPKEQEASTYYRQISTRGVELEEGKSYLVFLNYDKETKTYKIFDNTFGIMEYDPQTNKVKNIDTGEFEEFDWDLIK